MKKWKVVLEYNVQRTFLIDAKDYDAAIEKAEKGQGDIDNDDWEKTDMLDCEEV